MSEETSEAASIDETVEEGEAQESQEQAPGEDACDAVRVRYANRQEEKKYNEYSDQESGPQQASAGKAQDKRGPKAYLDGFIVHDPEETLYAKEVAEEQERAKEAAREKGFSDKIAHFYNRAKAAARKAASKLGIAEESEEDEEGSSITAKQDLEALLKQAEAAAKKGDVRIAREKLYDAYVPFDLSTQDITTYEGKQYNAEAADAAKRMAEIERTALVNGRDKFLKEAEQRAAKGMDSALSVYKFARDFNTLLTTRGYEGAIDLSEQYASIESSLEENRGKHDLFDMTQPLKYDKSYGIRREKVLVPDGNGNLIPEIQTSEHYVQTDIDMDYHTYERRTDRRSQEAIQSDPHPVGTPFAYWLAPLEKNGSEEGTITFIDPPLTPGSEPEKTVIPTAQIDHWYGTPVKHKPDGSMEKLQPYSILKKSA